MQNPSSQSLAPNLRKSIESWAQHTPRVRRVWVCGTPDKGSDLDLAVEVEPAGDSEESITRWMTLAEKWKAELQQTVAANVDLDWFDPDGSTPRVQQAIEKATLVYDRAVNP